MTPLPYRVISRAPETADTWTLLLEPLAEPVIPQPGQFNMLYAFGVGEVPISTSAGPDPAGALVHTIRDVGPVSHALAASAATAVVGVRGPYGTVWPLDEAKGRDLVIVAGGIGLAPLRPAIYHALTHRDDFASVCVLVGARTPAELLFVRELEDWRGRFDVDLDVTVDNAREGWHGRVGVVTQLIPRAPFDPATALALVCGPELMMTFTARALLGRGLPKESIYISMERNMRCGLGHCGHCQLGPMLICRDGPVFRFDEMERLMEVRELCSRPTVAVWKFSSCDGCQLTLLDCEDELLAIAGAIEIAYFPEATSAELDGPYDISLVEGSVTTPHDVARIHEIREQSGLLVTIGACATSGGIQALRNFADVQEWIPIVYASPEFISTLDTSTPIADHVRVDLELRGCPISKQQLVETVLALLNGRPPRLPSTSVCFECKARGTACVMVANGTPCLGPVTHAGCGAICPAYNRGCYGCFGPMESPNVDALAAQWRALGMREDGIVRALRTFNANAPAFREASSELV